MSKITFKPMVANTPAKAKKTSNNHATPSTPKKISTPSLKDAVMGRSKLYSKKGTQSSAIRD